jgi:hypothetical protein
VQRFGRPSKSLALIMAQTHARPGQPRVCERQSGNADQDIDRSCQRYFGIIVKGSMQSAPACSKSDTKMVLNVL